MSIDRVSNARRAAVPRIPTAISPDLRKASLEQLGRPGDYVHGDMHLGASMKAICCLRYGPPEVLELREMPVPRPKGRQVLVRVHATSVTLGDCEVRAFRLPGWIWLPARLAFGVTRPRQPVLGLEVAGEVVETGSAVTRFKIGDRIFGSTGFGMGTYAEFTAVPEKAAITTIPDGVSYAEAAGIPTGGLNGLHFVRKCALKPGERVLINGAGGSIGTFAVQLARREGAVVTAVDSAEKLPMLTALGADQVIDYRSTDFWSTGERWDAIIDVVGTCRVGDGIGALNDRGRLMLGNPRTGQVLRGFVANRRGRVKVMAALAGESVADLDLLKGLVADGALRVVTDRHFPLEAIPEAHRYVESGVKQGVVLIDVVPAPAS